VISGILIRPFFFNNDFHIRNATKDFKISTILMPKNKKTENRLKNQYLILDFDNDKK
jgi:hypothetical protein